MKVKRFMALLTLPILFLLVACQSGQQKTTTSDSSSSSQETKTSKSQSSKQTAKEVLDKVKKANEELVSVKMDLGLKIYNDSTSPSKDQKMTGSMVYEKDTTNVAKAHLFIDTMLDKKKTYQEMIMPGKTSEGLTLYTRTEKNGDWIKKSQSGDGHYTVSPDYLSLIESIVKLSDDFDVKESGNQYILTLKNQNVDVLSLFGEQFNIELTGITQAEADKKVVVKIDKDSYYMKTFQFDLTYSGKKGSLKIETLTNYQAWNQIDASSIEEPTEKG